MGFGVGGKPPDRVYGFDFGTVVSKLDNAKIGARWVTRPVLMWYAKWSMVATKEHAPAVIAVVPALAPMNASTWIRLSFFSWLIVKGNAYDPVASVALVTLMMYEPSHLGFGAGSVPSSALPPGLQASWLTPVAKLTSHSTTSKSLMKFSTP